jgi:small subunit ribosomal protein S1
VNSPNQHDPQQQVSDSSGNDDGWWKSILSEEQKYAGAERPRRKPMGQASRRPEEQRSRGAGERIRTRRTTTDRAKGSKPQMNGEYKPVQMDWVDWTRVLELQEQETVCYAEVVGFNRGGLLVRTQEFQGFVPRSHLAAAINGQKITEQLLESFVGHEMELKVIECDPERGRIVLSERAAQSAPGSRHGLLQTLQVGQQIEGVVTNVTPFGLFIDLGGVEGLVHISELSWGRVGHPKEVASPGDKLNVVVLELQSDRGRVSLSVKRGLPNPWSTAPDRYPVGTDFDAEITEVVHFGAFAKLEEGLEGLIHITQMGLHHRLDPRLVLESGMKVKVRVLQVEPDRQRLSLQLLGEPWKSEEAQQGPSWLDTPGDNA